MPAFTLAMMAGAQRIGVVDAVAARQRGSHQGHHLVAGVRPARRNCDLFQSMVSEVFQPRWAGILGTQGWSEAWLDHVRGQNVAMFAPEGLLPDSECRSIAKSCFRYWTLNYDPERFNEIQTARMGKRWHGDFAFDFDLQAQDVRDLKAWGLKQVTIGAVVGALVEKSDKGYQQLQKATVDMRDGGMLPYSWIEDSSRRAYMNTGYAGVGSFAEVAASIYRRDYWESTNTLVEVWCESRSLAGVLGQVCREYVVPLFPSGGFASLSFLYQAATHIQESGRAHAVILYVGDYDQAGVLIDRAIEGRLRDFLAAWDGELTFHRLAVNDDQIDRMGLPTRPPKGSDTRSPEVTRAVEAEAIPAPAMRGIVSSSLQELIPERVLTVQRLVEKQEQNDIYTRLLR